MTGSAPKGPGRYFLLGIEFRGMDMSNKRYTTASDKEEKQQRARERRALARPQKEATRMGRRLHTHQTVRAEHRNGLQAQRWSRHDWRGSSGRLERLVLWISVRRKIVLLVLTMCCFSNEAGWGRSV